MTVTTINFNSGNPFSVGPVAVHSPAQNLPATVTEVTLNLLDPNGDWVNPANAGGLFQYGIEFSTDGGTTWQILVANYNPNDPTTGDPVGAKTRSGGLPFLTISRTTGIQEAFGLPCRAAAKCSKTITIAASATVTH